MKTNYRMLKELNFTPQNFGWLTGDEVETLREHFQIEKRSDVELQNLRDFVVMYYADKTRLDMKTADLMSAITGVIDEEKVSRGLEV